jgi:ParB/RepB/Spo0J family partition protein
MTMKDKLAEIKVSAIAPSKHNTRRIRANDPAVKELAESIKCQGLLQPVIVRPAEAGKFELLAGRRRFEATKLLKGKTILAICKDVDDQTALEITCLENLQRNNLTPIEEARSVRALLNDGKNAAQVAAAIGKSVTWVVRRAHLAGLAPEILESIDDPEGAMAGATVGHLEILASVSREEQTAIFKEYSDNRKWVFEPQYLGEFRELVVARTRKLKGAIFKTDDAVLCPRAGACDKCAKRSSATPGLFDDELDAAKILADDTCLDGACYDAKLKAMLAKIEEALRKQHPKLLRVASVPMTHGERQDKKNDGIIDKFDYGIVAKGKGTPALVVKGPGAGKVIYVEVNGQDEKKTAKPEPANEKEAAKAAAESVALKRELLEKRRKALVIGKVKELVEKWERPFKGDTVVHLALAAAFGLSEAHEFQGGKEWNALTRLATETQEARDLVWKMLVPVLKSRLSFLTVGDCDKAYREAEKICELMAFAIESLLAEACRELPEPKSWGKGKEGDAEDGEKGGKA